MEPGLDHFSIEATGYSLTRTLGKMATCITKGTIPSSIFNLLTTSVGAGTLALPYAFKEGGLVYANAVFFFIMIIAVIVGLYLFNSKRRCQEVCPTMVINGYEDLAEVTFGPIGRAINILGCAIKRLNTTFMNYPSPLSVWATKFAVLLTMVIFLYLALIAYMIYTRDQLSFFIKFIYDRVDKDTVCSLQNCALLTAMAFIPIFPVTLLKKMTLLQFTSAISIFCVIFVDIMVTIKTAEYVKDNSSSIHIEVTSSKDIALFPNSLSGAVTCVSYCSLGFVCHFQLFSLEKELHRPKRWKLVFIVVASMIIAYCIYIVIAIMGYITFAGSTAEDIMVNYDKSPLVTAARLALFFTLLFSYPILLHPTRAAFNNFILYVYEQYKGRHGNTNEEDEFFINQPVSLQVLKAKEKKMFKRVHKEPGLALWLIETILFFVSSLVIASLIDNVGYVWNFVGCIGGTLILYVYPPLFYLRVRYFMKQRASIEDNTTLLEQYNTCETWKDIVAVAIVILGVVLLAVGIYVAVEAIVNAKHQPYDSCNIFTCNITGSDSAV